MVLLGRCIRIGHLAYPRSRPVLDFLVVQPEVENAAEESVRLRHALRDLLVPMDIVVVREGEVAKWRDVRGSLVHSALVDGRVLTV